MLDESSYYLSDEAEAAFRQYLTIRTQQPRFANAGASGRAGTGPAPPRAPPGGGSAGELEPDDLMRLEPLDILTSPVFSLSAIDE